MEGESAGADFTIAEITQLMWRERIGRQVALGGNDLYPHPHPQTPTPSHQSGCQQQDLPCLGG